MANGGSVRFLETASNIGASEAERLRREVEALHSMPRRHNRDHKALAGFLIDPKAQRRTFRRRRTGVEQPLSPPKQEHYPDRRDPSRMVEGAVARYPPAERVELRLNKWQKGIAAHRRAPRP